MLQSPLVCGQHSEGRRSSADCLLDRDARKQRNDENDTLWICTEEGGMAREL